jgi:hypothetical protein
MSIIVALQGDSTMYDAIFCAMLFFLTFEILPHIASLANEDKLFRRLHNNLALIRLFNNVYDIFYFGLLDIGICIIYSVSIFVSIKKMTPDSSINLLMFPLYLMRDVKVMSTTSTLVFGFRV